MDIQAIRTELLGPVPAGFNGYDRLPGVAKLPAIVIGLPENVSYEGSTLGSGPMVTLPLFVMVANPMTAEAEIKLLDAVNTVATAYRGATGSTFRTCRVTAINQFFAVTVGKTNALSATVNLSLMAS